MECPDSLSEIIREGVECVGECVLCEPCVIVARECRPRPGDLTGRRTIVYRGSWGRRRDEEDEPARLDYYR